MAATFRRPGSGATIASDADDEASKNFFMGLAAQSRGIPWIAWWLWRRSLRQPSDNKTNGQTDSRQTLWVADYEEMKLPNRHEPDELLVLHALLIHGPISDEMLTAVMPTMRGRGIVQSLIAAGVVARVDGVLHCQPAAYPAVRRGLIAAGFPIDAL